MTTTIRSTYSMWPQYNRRVRDVVADLTDEQLAIRPGPDVLPIWAIVQRRASFERGKAAARGFALRPAPPQPHFSAQLLADLGREHGGARNLRR